MSAMMDILLAWPPEMMYVAISAITAVCLWAENTMLRTNAGKMPESTFFYVLSAFGSLWFVVSLAVLYFLDFSNITICVPVAYVVYTMINWVYGAKVMTADGLPDNPNDIVLPPKLLSFSQSFALVFFGFCMLVLFRPQSFDIFLMNR